jgi:hypothetical protein
MLLLTNIYDFIMQHFLCPCAHFHSQYTVSSHCIHRNIIMLDKLQKMCNTAKKPPISNMRLFSRTAHFNIKQR